jgi:glycosyltransferase involved in cell wall biosynthesis
MRRTQPVRVLYCIEAMVHGGTERQLAALLRGLDRTRITPALCLLKPSSMDLRTLDCPVLELGFHSFRTPAALGCLRRLRRFIVDERIDIVQTYFQDPTLMAWLASMWTPVRARIASFRDMGFWRTSAKVAQLRLAYPSFDGFIANSPAVARHVHQLDGIPLERLEIIPNGVEISPRAAAGRPLRPVVGIVANLDRPVKRVDLFLEAARLVRDVIDDVEFVVVGDGYLREPLREQAQRLGLAEVVRFTGSLPDAAVEIRRFSIGVISSDSEGLSNAILEYMAAGVPTVARAVGGNAEAVIDGETGLLVEGGEPRALADAVVTLLRDERRHRLMGERARAVAERGFSMEICVRRHEAYYEKVLAAAARPGHRTWGLW